jgi:hypothetical protein
MSSRICERIGLLAVALVGCSDARTIDICGRGDHAALAATLAGGTFTLIYRDGDGAALATSTVPADRRSQADATVPARAASLEVIGADAGGAMVAHGTSAVSDGRACVCVALVGQELAACRAIACTVADDRCAFTDAATGEPVDARTLVFGDNASDDVRGVTADTTLHVEQPTTILGGKPTISSDTEPMMSALLRFELTALPRTSAIDTARLAVQLDSDNPESRSNQPLPIFRVLEPWTEDGASWNARDASHAWSVPGCRYDPSATVASRAMVQSATIVSPDTPGMTYDLDVTDDVRTFAADPAANFGWAAEAIGDEVDLVAREHPEPAARPRLIVTYRLDPGDNARLSPMMSGN